MQSPPTGRDRSNARQSSLRAWEFIRRSSDRHALAGALARRFAGVLIAFCCCQEQVYSAQTYLESMGQSIYSGVGLTSPPGDGNRAFVSLVQFDTVRIVDLNSKTTLPTPFLQLDDNVVSHSVESGFFGITFDPNYADNGYFYASYSAAADNAIHVVRYNVLGDPATSNTADPDSAYPILRIEHPAPTHFSGWLGFSPIDGYLYMTVGDGGCCNDNGPGHTEATGNAQDLTDNLLGKLLRIDVHGDDFPTDAGRNYAIPESNPFVGKTGDDEIFAYGLRNAWRAGFDRVTGDLWFGDVGESQREEVNRLPANSGGGQNYGWRLREGSIATPTGNVGGPRPEGNVDPVYDYSHLNGSDPDYQGNAVIGGYVYRGSVAAFQGDYFFGDFATGSIWRLDPDAVDPRASVVKVNDLLVADSNPLGRFASFGEDGVGEMYVTSFGPNYSTYRFATLSKDAVWNGTNSSGGGGGNGVSWGESGNWTRDGQANTAFVAEDPVVFAPGSAVSTIDLEEDRVVAAATFQAPYTLENATLQVLSGNVTVDAGVTATVKSSLVSSSPHHSVRKLGPGRLLVEGNAGQIAVKEGILGGSGTLDHLTIRSGGTVAPGASIGVLHVANSFRMESGSVLSIEIGGDDNSDLENLQFDQLLVDGAAALAGTLEVQLTDLGGGVFDPELGDTFAVLTSGTGVTGALESLLLPTLKTGLVWRLDMSGAAVELQVANRLPGDYNGDGIVNAADYTVWRDTVGSAGDHLAADGTGPNGVPDGMVDIQDYEFWKSQFGTVEPQGAGSVQAPSPNSFRLIGICAVIVSMCRQRWPKVFNVA